MQVFCENIPPRRRTIENVTEDTTCGLQSMHLLQLHTAEIANTVYKRNRHKKRYSAGVHFNCFPGA